MRITVLELPARWGAPTAVLAAVEAALGHATDLVVLPEAALHGYLSPAGDTDLTPFGEALDGPTSRACAKVAMRFGVHLVASLVLREGDALFNAMVCFDPRGQIAFVYRKRHPWFPETWATPGPHAPPLVEIAGKQVTIAVCYDVHFLDDDAVRELTAADVLLFPSAWVEEPDLRVPRLVRLAKKYGVTIVNANWAAGDVRVPGQGGSCIISPAGAVIARVVDGRIDHEIT